MRGVVQTGTVVEASRDAHRAGMAFIAAGCA